MHPVNIASRRAYDTRSKLNKESSMCCRCRGEIPQGDEMGGTFGGVVCIKHRSCFRCWFRMGAKDGYREYEDIKTQEIPLVDNPRKGKKPVCFGCLYKLKPHKSFVERQDKIKKSLEGVDLTASGKSADDAIELF